MSRVASGHRLSKLLPLPALLALGRSDDFVVARRGGMTLCWRDLRERVSALMHAMEREVEAVPGQRWLLCCEDSFAFAAGLLALWQRGAVAVIPPNDQPGTLVHHAARTAGLIYDGVLEDESEARRLPRIDPTAVGEAGVDVQELGPFVTLNSEMPAIDLFTSGTSGDPKAVSKNLSHLSAEIDFLEEQWGERLGESSIFATVSHQHLYGLLFRLLWPLCAGRVFRLERLLLAEELFPRMEAEAQAALVSSPTHLARMGDVSRLRGSCRAIYSSGGPLKLVTAERVAAEFGAEPIEVYGSTETGGLAWRQQKAEAEGSLWTPFDGVRLEVDAEGGLRVASPYVSVCEAGSFYGMGDRAELRAGGRFALLGRADRVVKLGEKRLSLAAMEERLRENPLLEDARLLLLTLGQTERIGCVAVLSSEGAQRLEREGRRLLGQSLRDYLAPFWDRILLPRAWRYVARLPEDRQGKVNQAALRALFAEDGAAGVTKPEVLAESWQEDRCSLELRVPEGLLYLEGHFSGLPVVAGVVQMEWVVDALARLLGEAPRIQQMDGLKFASLLQPGDTFTLQVEVSRAADPQALAGKGTSARFQMTQGERVFSCGTFRLSGDTT